MKIFAIESSHDDTSFAILEDNKPIWMKNKPQGHYRNFPQLFVPK